MNTSTEPAAPRSKAISLILWIAARLPAFGIGMAGLAKFYRSAFWEQLFVSWGYPTWLSKVVGIVEMMGAILAFVPRTTLYGIVILAITMAAAFLTLFTHQGGRLGWGLTPLTYFVWLCVLAIVRWRKRSPLATFVFFTRPRTPPAGGRRSDPGSSLYSMPRRSP